MEKHPDPLSAVLLVLMIGDVPSSSPGCLLPEPSDRLSKQIQTATVLADQVQSSINKNKWSLSLIFAEMAIKSVESCFSFLNLQPFKDLVNHQTIITSIFPRSNDLSRIII